MVNHEDLTVVYVEWIDSTSMGDGKWIDIENVDYDPEEDQALTCYTAGFLANETETELRIIQSCHNGGRLHICSLLIIPKVAVLNIQYLMGDENDEWEMQNVI